MHGYIPSESGAGDTFFRNKCISSMLEHDTYMFIASMRGLILFVDAISTAT